MILATVFAVISCMVGEGIIYGIRFRPNEVGPFIVLGVAFAVAVSMTIALAAPCKDKLGVFMCG